MNTAATLRLVWPQWQGAGRDNVAALLPEVPLERARLGYLVGAQTLQAILPPHSGPTEIVPVSREDSGEGSTGGIESRSAVVASLVQAQQAIARHDPERILTLGGECSVSVAPFTALAKKYGDDLAVVWIDSHPDVDTADTSYDGYHAMALSTIVGQGDRAITGTLPATVDPSRVAIAGLHDWTEDAYPNVAKWGITTFAPDDLRSTSDPLIGWLDAMGVSKVAIHFDVDVVDSDEVVLGLGKVPGGLSSRDVGRIVDDISRAADVVGVTVAEFIPRQTLVLAGMLQGFPLIGD